MIEGNVLRGEGQNYGIYTEGLATIIGNNITNCYTGIYAVGATDIRVNIIMNNVHDGVRSENQASSIEYNVAANNDCGISGNGNILHNTVAYNAVAGLWSPSPTATIYKNNIYDNFENVHLTENATDVQAQHNWWGTINAETIDKLIWDIKDAPHLGNLFYTPFLTTLNKLALAIPLAIPFPTQPPEPTTTAAMSPSPKPTEMVTGEPTPTQWGFITPNPTRFPYETLMPIEPTYGKGKVDLTGIAVVTVAIVVGIAILAVITRLYSRTPRTPSRVHGRW